jgi:hypothetical protein
MYNLCDASQNLEHQFYQIDMLMDSTVNLIKDSNLEDSHLHHSQHNRSRMHNNNHNNIQANLVKLEMPTPAMIAGKPRKTRIQTFRATSLKIKYLLLLNN